MFVSGLWKWILYMCIIGNARNLLVRVIRVL